MEFELTNAQREAMLQAWQTLSDQALPEERLSFAGLQALPRLVEQALNNGDQTSLTASLINPIYWHQTASYGHGLLARERRVPIDHAAYRLSWWLWLRLYNLANAQLWFDQGLRYATLGQFTAEHQEPAACPLQNGIQVELAAVLEQRLLVPSGFHCCHGLVASNKA
ncbi:MAG TPA: hypothetical protein DEF47_19905 [Herpetosiphon sp.]|uniref:Uncharacterized protein n=1 Tax=Herpetosiphon aurantiacus (strain ATCC 23779 / DSM 785 / 114-95) TaxID=316274 RepID=A9B3N8_HERA2|nr:hypothetical protein [Herpetosiphon sp.]ABX05610.1 hypothetical protein Haur_2972 [Herpetosiphon aurantiacus DSM 785]HBW52158.1 hypothetical protein [Herpetosiphon sp.]